MRLLKYVKCKYSRIRYLQEELQALITTFILTSQTETAHEENYATLNYSWKAWNSSQNFHLNEMRPDISAPDCGRDYVKSFFIYKLARRKQINSVE